MKYSIVLMIISLVLYSSCTKETGNSVVQSSPRLSVIKSNGMDESRYYYSEDRLIEIQSDYLTVNQETGDSEMKTSHRYLEYDNDKLSRVYGEGSEILITYEGLDLTIHDFHHQFEDATMTFINYQDPGNFRVVITYSEDLDNKFSPVFDQESNYLYASDDSGLNLEDAYPGFAYLSQYYGSYDYIEMNNIGKNFDLEVQLFLYQKPFNHCVKSIERNTKRIEYSYEFDENQYPTTSEAMTIYHASNDTLFHGVKEYVYE